MNEEDALATTNTGPSGEPFRDGEQPVLIRGAAMRPAILSSRRFFTASLTLWVDGRSGCAIRYSRIPRQPWQERPAMQLGQVRRNRYRSSSSPRETSAKAFPWPLDGFRLAGESRGRNGRFRGRNRWWLFPLSGLRLGIIEPLSSGAESPSGLPTGGGRTLTAETLAEGSFSYRRGLKTRHQAPGKMRHLRSYGEAPLAVKRQRNGSPLSKREMGVDGFWRVLVV